MKLTDLALLVCGVRNTQWGAELKVKPQAEHSPDNVCMSTPASESANTECQEGDQVPVVVVPIAVDEANCVPEFTPIPKGQRSRVDDGTASTPKAISFADSPTGTSPTCAETDAGPTAMDTTPAEKSAPCKEGSQVRAVCMYACGCGKWREGFGDKLCPTSAGF